MSPCVLQSCVVQHTHTRPWNTITMRLLSLMDKPETVRMNMKQKKEMKVGRKERKLHM